MARSDPPFDAADDTTTQPTRRPEPAPTDAKSEGAHEPTAPRVTRQNTNWFELGFDAEDTPTTVEREPLVEGPVEPSGMDTVAAEIAAALMSPEPEHAPTATFVGASAHVAPAPVPAPAIVVPPYAPARAHPQRPEVGDLIVRAGKVAAIVFCAWFCVVLALIAIYRFVNPPFSALMAAQWLSGTTIRQDWVPLESISPNLIQAVVVSEDGRFCEHWGIDFVEIAEALKRTPHGPPRGASTITMQVAKNLFLWPAKSYARKVIEVPLTYAIELFWPKRRILEVYLNIAEWGPGVFGAEAASQVHFNRSAGQLSARQAAQLAVALPNPIIRDAGAPGPRTAHQASVIQRRTGREPETIGCVMTGE
jgi:monofunctional glycosyltransferase